MTKARDIASAIPAPSTVSSTELGYLDGVTSAVQTQLDAKTPNYKLIQTTTFSAVASISLNSVFTSTYENYEIYISLFPTSTADTTTFRLRASGTDETTNYESGRHGFNGSVVFSGLNVTGTDDWYIGYDGTATNSCAKMTIFRPQIAAPTKFISTGVSGSMPFQTTGGTNSNSTSYDGFTLLILSGTFTGNVSVYGLAK